MTICKPKKVAQHKKKKIKGKLSPEEKTKLFNQYIMPLIADVKSLTIQYTNNYKDVDENFNHCLAQLYNYIGTYNPEQKLFTWIHIVVKRACYQQNQKRFEESSHWTDLEMCSMEDLYKPGNSLVVSAKFGTLLDNLSDQMLNVLMSLNPLKLSPFMLHTQGLRIREITEMEWKKGHLERKSEDIVKSRIFWAKKELAYLLKKHGITRQNY